LQEVVFIDEPNRAHELLKPLRIDMLARLAEPGTCSELARALGTTTQKINYHMNALREAGLVNLVEERRKRGTIEGIYQATARSYWFSPRMITQSGRPREATDRASLGFLLKLAEELQIEAGQLAGDVTDRDISSLGLDAQITLRNEHDRQAFMHDLQKSIKQLAEKYGSRHNGESTTEDAYRLILACYPRQSKHTDTNNA